MSKEARTERYEDLWRPAVATASALTTEDAKDGQMCFVQDEEVIYAFQRGKWVAVVRPKPSGAADA